MHEREVASLNLTLHKTFKFDSKIIVKNERSMGMIIGSGWRVVHIILKNVLLYFGGFLRFLICRVFFFAECFLTLGNRKKYSAKNRLLIKCLSGILCQV